MKRFRIFIESPLNFDVIENFVLSFQSSRNIILWKIFQNSAFFENFPIFCFLEIQNFGKFDRRFCLWKIRRIRKLRKNQKFVVLLWLHKRAQTCTNDAQTIDLSFNSNGSMRAEMELVCPQPPPPERWKKNWVLALDLITCLTIKNCCGTILRNNL